MAFKSNKTAVIAALKAAQTDALEECGALCTATYKMTCAVDTGAMRESAKYEVAGPKLTIGVFVFYAAFVELGTSRQRAQPALIPCVIDNMDRMNDIFLKHLNK